MLGGTRLSAILGSGVDPTDPDAMRAYVRACCEAGLAVLLITPASKEPADLRTPQKRRMDDTAARAAAREAGRPDADRVRSASGLHLATSDVPTALRYLDRYFDLYGAQGTQEVAVNLAVEVGRSRLVVADCDTPQQVSEFLQMTGADQDIPPTIRTPGKQLPDGAWVHHDGGHFWFTVPDGVDMPSEIGSCNIGETGVCLLWHHRYVLIPPSTRAEGAYELEGRDYPLPENIHGWIAQRCERRADTASRNRLASSADDRLSASVDAWAAALDWGRDILGPLGWVPVSSPDACGCPMFTAPGEHSSPKSATAHDAGCGRGSWTNDVNAPLHIWTTNPGEPFAEWIDEHGTSTITKLTAIALTEYKGNIGEALSALGLGSGGVDLPDVDPAALARETPSSSLDEDLPPVTDVGLPGLGSTPLRDEPEQFPGDADAELPLGFYSPVNAGMPTIAPFRYWADMPPPEFLVDGLIEHGGLSCLVGPSGVGKSTIAIDLACHIAMGHTWQGRSVLKTNVLYLPGEGMAGVVQRIRAWCEARDLEPDLPIELGNPILTLTSSREAWAEMRAYLAAREIGLVVFDTFARCAVGLDENSATDVNKAVKRFDQVREMTSVGVMIVHHTGWTNQTRIRGSSALNAALDSEILVTANGEPVDVDGHRLRPIGMSVTKQKNVEFDPEETLEMAMTNWRDYAPIITGPNGNVDPMVGDIMFAPPVPEPVVETAIRVQVFAQRFTEQGVTRADVVTSVAPDPYTARRRDAPRAWKIKVHEAIDRALRYDLLETLTGTLSGARYIPSTATPEQARIAAAAEIGANDEL